jgi:hypothetical protein
MRITKLLGFVLLFLALASQVMALGVSPAQKVIHFEPGLQITDELRILNDDGKDIDIAVFLQGEFNEYVLLDHSIVSFESGETEQRLKYIVDLPLEISTPGEHVVDVVLMELSQQAGDGTTITGRAAVASSIKIRVPFPGAYAEADLQVRDREQVEFTMPVHNLGTQELAIEGEIEVAGPNNEELALLETTGASIKSKQSSKLTSNWDAPTLGEYRALATVNYEDEFIKVEKDFTVGDHLIIIEDISSPRFNLQGINKIIFDVYNNWNTPSNDVYAEVVVSDQKGNVKHRLDTSPITLEAFGSGSLEAFWDTSGVSPGIYSLSITVYHEGSTLGKGVDIEIDEHSFKVLGQREQKSPFENPLLLIVISVNLLITLTVVLWIVVNARKKK